MWHGSNYTTTTASPPHMVTAIYTHTHKTVSDTIYTWSQGRLYIHRQQVNIGCPLFTLSSVLYCIYWRGYRIYCMISLCLLIFPLIFFLLVHVCVVVETKPKYAFWRQPRGKQSGCGREISLLNLWTTSTVCKKQWGASLLLANPRIQLWRSRNVMTVWQHPEPSEKQDNHI